MARTTFTVTIVILLLAGQALAQVPGRYRSYDRKGRWELSLQTRYVASKTFETDGGSSVAVKDKLGWGFGFGYNLSEQFNLGINVSWRRLPYDATVVNASDPADKETVSGTMDSSTFGFAGLWTPLKGTISPYVNGGLGWMSIDTNIVAGVEDGCWYYPWWGYVCGPVARTYGVNATVYNLGLGARIALSPDLFLRVGYEHGWTSNDTYDGADIFRLEFGGLL